MLKKEIAVQLMEHLCNHDSHGYSQVSRWGDGSGTCPVAIGGKTYYLEQGDRDCSSAIVSAFEAAGISCGGASYTGNMRSCMVGTGNFKWHPMSSGYIAQRGDVYLKEGAHTAMCTSSAPGMLAEFSISETDGIDGVEGDQTGVESYIHAYYNYPWDGILECVCTATDGNTQPVPGWNKNDEGWWWMENDGSYPKSAWKYIGAYWYWFDERGYMVTGWKELGGIWYYFHSSGRMLTGWQQIGGIWYYFDENGHMLEGTWLEDGDYIYYLKLGGHMAIGRTNIDGEDYFFNEDKNCQPIGSMFLNHWITDDGNKYYLKDSGKMAKNETLEIGGKKYSFSESGAVVR